MREFHFACDSHVHCFDPQAFPFGLARAYTPGSASVEELLGLHQGLGIGRAVFVQPSVYGNDNRCQLDAMAKYNGIDGHEARGVAVLNGDTIHDEELSTLHAKGMRGVRLNLRVAKSSDSTGLSRVKQELNALARVLGRFSSSQQWHIQLHASFEVHRLLLDDYCRIAQAGVPIVLDHFAGAALDDIEPLISALSKAEIYVKLSAAYRLPAPQQAGALACAFYDVAPDRVLWASDWPHTGGTGAEGRKPEDIEPFRSIDNASALNIICKAIGTKGTEQMLVHNPSTLYDFEIIEHTYA